MIVRCLKIGLEIVVNRGGSKGAPSKNSAPPCGPPMKFMIKHNLPLVRVVHCGI